MEDVLDNLNVLMQRDSEQTLDAAVRQAAQVDEDIRVVNAPDHSAAFQKIIFTGMGGSALAPMLVKAWLADHLRVPVEICRNYTVPNHVGPESLVIAISCSGNTEETCAAYEDARQKGARVTVIAKGGKLLEDAQRDAVAYATLPDIKIQPRMLTIAQLTAIIRLLIAHDMVGEEMFDELRDACHWLSDRSVSWQKEVPCSDNPAKQLAMDALGKSAEFLGGPRTSAIAYKWKISWNENAKNVAFWNEYPEFNHNEFMGWSSHPVEKPYAIYDIRSTFDGERIQRRMELSDRLLSGKRPKATPIVLEGETLLRQLLWGSLFADFVSIYLAVLNNVDPGPVGLIEKFKKELG